MSKNLTPIPPLQHGLYRHYKGGEYRVVDLARHSETQEWMVVYQCLRDNASLWVRPHEMFIETVIIDGVEQPRFAYQGAR